MISRIVSLLYRLLLCVIVSLVSSLALSMLSRSFKSHGIKSPSVYRTSFERELLSFASWKTLLVAISISFLYLTLSVLFLSVIFNCEISFQLSVLKMWDSISVWKENPLADVYRWIIVLSMFKSKQILQNIVFTAKILDVKC